ncbi:hypothetical protein Dimus_001483 [Dionaea muscipula]
MLGRLCTMDSLRWELENRLYLLRGTEVETSQHLFFKCSCSRGVWTQICFWCNIPPSLTSHKALVNWIKARSRQSGSRGTALRITLAATVYYLWKTRNDLQWNKIPFDPAFLVRKVKSPPFVADQAVSMVLELVSITTRLLLAGG